MKTRIAFLPLFALLAGLGLLTAREDGVRAFEVGAGAAAELPQGKEADGIIGDFVLRNGVIEATVSGNQPLRRANMATEYASSLNGALFDLDLRGAGNDQITAFRPGGLQGRMSWVRVLDDGSRGAAAIEAVRTAPLGGGLYERHEYRLEEDWQHILVRSTYRNESEEPVEIAPRPSWKGLRNEQKVGGIRAGDSIDPFDKRAYAWGPAPDAEAPPEKAELAPGEERTYAVALAVAGSPLAAYGIAAAAAGEETGEVAGGVTTAGGEPAIHARLAVTVEGEELLHYPGPEGEVEFRLPQGDYEVRFEDLGREPVQKALSVEAGRRAMFNLEVPPAAKVRFDIRGEDGGRLPAKVQFIGVEGTPTPDFGVDNRAHGGDHQYQTHNGRFTQQTPPGRYLIRITRGPEYDLFEKEIEVRAAETTRVEATLNRSVKTPGWVMTDFHSHSTPSGDNYTNTDDRIINLAAEHIEFAPATEHNRIYEWTPHIERLGVGDLISTVTGIELTGRGQHFNAFPLEPHPYAERGGAPLWHFDPRINAITLRNWGTPTLEEGGSRYDVEVNAIREIRLFGGGPERWVQANHPRVGAVFNDRNEDFVPDGGFEGLVNLIDAGEFWSSEILNREPVVETYTTGATRRTQNRTLGWLQMLNQGRRVWCVAVSDAHGIFRNGVGDWRTYVMSAHDDPARIDPDDVIRNAKAGRMVVTNGPFLKVSTADGLPIGSTVTAPGGVELDIEVQAPNWFDMDRVVVLVNGRRKPEYDFSRATHKEMFRDGAVRFKETVKVALQRDAHLIVVATSDESGLSKGWGRAEASVMAPMAYTNPIYVDTDGKGFEPSGDLLGQPLLVAPPEDL